MELDVVLAWLRLLFICFLIKVYLYYELSKLADV